MKKFVCSALALFFVTTAVAQEMKKTAAGALYRIVKRGNGKAIKPGDVITFNFVQKNAKDSVLMSSYTSGTPVKIRVTEARSVADLMDVFPLLAEKDSAVIQVPTDSIFKAHEDQRPAFLPKGSPLTFHINIVRVQSVDEATAEGKRTADSLKAVEKGTATSYLAANTLALTTTPSGLMYQVTTPSAGIKPAKGDTLLVNYTGSTLDGKVFDSSIQENAVKAGLQQPGRKYEPIRLVVGNGEVIPGWDEGLLLFNEGSKGVLIVPSELAYGERGAGDAIKPFSTLRFDIELVKVLKTVPPKELKQAERAKLSTYLAANKLALTTTGSGLKYVITKAGTGLKAVKGDTLRVNYIGTTLDGKIFDTSLKSVAEKAGLDQPGREYEPITLVVANGEVIPGWDEGLLLLNTGAKATFIIPSDLAYAERGAGDVIKPYNTLRFDLELVQITRPKKAVVKKPAPTVRKPAAAPAKKIIPAKKPAAKKP